MSVIGLEENPVACDCHATIGAGGLKPRGSGAHGPPHLASAARVQRDAFIYIADIHQPARYHRGRLQTRWRPSAATSKCAGIGKNPAWRQPADRRFVNLSHGDVAVAPRVPVVLGPVNFGRHLAKFISGPAEKMDSIVVCSDLKIEKALAELNTFDFLSIGCCHSDALFMSMAPGRGARLY